MVLFAVHLCPSAGDSQPGNSIRSASSSTPVALLFLVGYSYTKRFTWLCHLALGLTDGIAPIGGWLAVNPTISVANLVPPLLLGLAGRGLGRWIRSHLRLPGYRIRPRPWAALDSRALWHDAGLQISEMAHGASMGLLAAVGGN